MANRWDGAGMAILLGNQGGRNRYPFWAERTGPTVEFHRCLRPASPLSTIKQPQSMLRPKARHIRRGIYARPAFDRGDPRSRSPRVTGFIEFVLPQIL